MKKVIIFILMYLKMSYGFTQYGPTSFESFINGQNLSPSNLLLVRDFLNALPLHIEIVPISDKFPIQIYQSKSMPIVVKLMTVNKYDDGDSYNPACVVVSKSANFMIYGEGNGGFPQCLAPKKHQMINFSKGNYFIYKYLVKDTRKDLDLAGLVLFENSDGDISESIYSEKILRLSNRTQNIKLIKKLGVQELNILKNKQDK
ncbi:MAG: hypothetical protein Q4D78_01825 [Neisseria zoodegmatis]|uniref:hypothetical protein n=1 Tax=Neisseria zoodegmatis TaxID=326523 RepID=UPI0026EAA0E6|nr:hypothetical protein [Neisseria zoodegmatis]MDO5068931.1 hypothetical protein [Neisseria zoodegmatis]